MWSRWSNKFPDYQAIKHIFASLYIKKKNNDSNPAGTGKAALFLTELHFYRLGGQLCPKASRCNLVLLPPEKAFCDLVIGANYFP